MNSKHEYFADIPKNITLETMIEWQYKYISVLQTSPWSIEGEGILNIQDIVDPSIDFRLHSSILSKHLVSKLTKDGFTLLIKKFEHLIEKGHVVTLFFTLFDELLPQTTNNILDNIGSLKIFIKRVRNQQIISKFNQVGFGIE